MPPELAERSDGGALFQQPLDCLRLPLPGGAQQRGRCVGEAVDVRAALDEIGERLDTSARRRVDERFV